MARTPNCRRVGCVPGSNCFKPQGIPVRSLRQVTLTVDEFEAIRLADLQRLHQEQAAQEMDVSRQTFGRIIEQARAKVAEALVEGKALKIEGGDFKVVETGNYKCCDCQHTCECSCKGGRPSECPNCSSSNIQRTADGCDCGCGGREGCSCGCGSGGGGCGCQSQAE